MGASIMLAAGLLIVGSILFLIEAMIPSFGVIGVLGAAALIGSIGVAFSASPVAGTIFLVIAPVAAVGLFMAGLKILPHTRLGRSFILTGPASEHEQTVETGYERFTGREGVAASMLRPSGAAMVDSERLTVQTEGTIIEKGTRIRVVKVVGNKIFVEAV